MTLLIVVVLTTFLLSFIFAQVFQRIQPSDTDPVAANDEILKALASGSDLEVRSGARRVGKGRSPGWPPSHAHAQPQAASQQAEGSRPRGHGRGASVHRQLLHQAAALAAFQ